MHLYYRCLVQTTQIINECVEHHCFPLQIFWAPCCLALSGALSIAEFKSEHIMLVRDRGILSGSPGVVSRIPQWILQAHLCSYGSRLVRLPAVGCVECHVHCSAR